MKCPLSSNLVFLIEKAIDGCFYNGEAKIDDGKGLCVFAEWVSDPNKEGYSLIEITITENGVVKFTYVDYGTECRD